MNPHFLVHTEKNTVGVAVAKDIAPSMEVAVWISANPRTAREMSEHSDLRNRAWTERGF